MTVSGPDDRFPRVRGAVMAVALVGLAVAACSSTGGTPVDSRSSMAAPPSPSLGAAPRPTPSPTSGSSPTAGTEPIVGLFDIGGGRNLYLTCEGTGSPTILLEAGDESDIGQWRLVMPALQQETRTCAYERAGIGRSVEATGCRQLDDLLGDLEALLEAASVEGPYVLVGTSGGGFLMSALATRHPEDVKGLVLVETPKAITILPPELAARIACDAPTNIERRDYVTVERAVWAARTKLGDFPMTLISNDYGADAPLNDDTQTNVVDQRGWLVLSPNSKQVVVTSGHAVPENEPSLVIREVLAVLEAARQP